MEVCHQPNQHQHCFDIRSLSPSSHLMNNTNVDIDSITQHNNTQHQKHSTNTHHIAIGGGASIRGSIHEDLNQPNQDTFLVDQDHRLFGVFDGHGEQGHLVSSCIKQKLVEHFTAAQIKASSVEGAFRHTFESLDGLILARDESGSSGSTATVAYIEQDKLYLAAVGDCSAYLVEIDQNSDELKTTSLFSLHKPFQPEEEKRVKESGGKIAGEYVVHPTDDSKMINITRAFGDLDMKEACGVISKPEITVKSLDTDPDLDTFLVLSSDGLDCVPKDKMVRSVYCMIHECMQKDKDLNAMCYRLLGGLEKSMTFDSTNFFSDDTTLVVVLLS